MHRAAGLRFIRFGGGSDPLVQIERARPNHQVRYLRCYLHDLDARAVIVEPNYFDRDYLSEFAAFYATSAAGYSNSCRRLHFFSTGVTRDRFTRAAGGDASAVAALNDAYLGHVILRPIAVAPFGRTVLRTYPDDGAALGRPRIMKPKRTYHAHVAGVTLAVDGLAWQQQDSAVGACATVALWSMLHASAFDDHHAIPTTAEITSTAHRAMPDGSRMFPAEDGLHLEQMLEAIKAHGLAPVVIRGDGDDDRFSAARFCTLVASFIRSGYPVLVYGALDAETRSDHAVCIAGFRPAEAARVRAGQAVLADRHLEHVHVHDDNLGPNARFQVEIDEQDTVVLHPRAPAPRRGSRPTVDPTTEYHPIVPTRLVVATHQELRTAPLELQRVAVRCSHWLAVAMRDVLVERAPADVEGVQVSSRFIRLRDYVHDELALTLRDRKPAVLARARLQLWETVPPMSLHIGLVRVSIGTTPMMDVLFDTSDSDRHLAPSAYVAFHAQVPWLRRRWSELSGEDVALGRMVRAW